MNKLWVAGLIMVLVGHAAAQSTDNTPEASQLSSREITRYLHTYTQKPQRPQGVSTGRYRGVDTCRWANDGECDAPGIGTGACTRGTDYSDCWRIAEGVEDNSCQWANDNECDEPGFGTGACTQATDLTDCGSVIELRFRNDSCETAFDGDPARIQLRGQRPQHELRSGPDCYRRVEVCGLWRVWFAVRIARNYQWWRLW